MFYSYRGLNIYYEIMGKGDPIVFLHGWGCSLDIYKVVAKQISGKYCVYLLDFPGFGKSSEPDYVIDVVHMAEIVNEFVSSLGIVKPIIVGHSYGGRVAAEYAFKYKNINKLILIDSAGIKRVSLRKWFKVKLYKFKKVYYKFTKQVMKYNELLAGSGSKDYVNASVMMKKMLVKAVNYDQRKVFKKISVETLILWGKSDKSTPMKDGRLINRLIKNSEFVEIPDCGHFPFIENYGYFIKVFKSYLEV